MAKTTGERREYRRGIGKLKQCPPEYAGIAADTGLTDNEFYTVAYALSGEFDSCMRTNGPQDYFGCVFEAAVRVKRKGKPVTMLTVWGSGQGHIRTWDIRETANAVSVPRPRKNRDTPVEAAKRNALRPIRLERAHQDVDAWVPGTMLEEHLMDADTCPAPDLELSAWDEHHYSSDDTHELLVQILDYHTHPGAQMLREVVVESGETGQNADCRVFGPRVQAVAQQHGLRSCEVREVIMEFVRSIDGDWPTVLKVLRERGTYTTKDHGVVPGPAC